MDQVMNKIALTDDSRHPNEGHFVKSTYLWELLNKIPLKTFWVVQAVAYPVFHAVSLHSFHRIFSVYALLNLDQMPAPVCLETMHIFSSVNIQITDLQNVDLQIADDKNVDINNPDLYFPDIQLQIYPILTWFKRLDRWQFGCKHCNILCTVFL
jgi:hypothetical protein